LNEVQDISRAARPAGSDGSEQVHQLAEAALALARAPTLEAGLDGIAEAARRLIGAHRAAASLTRSMAGQPATPEENRPLRLTRAELEAHPRWQGLGGQAGALLPMRGWLAAPLVGQDGRNLGRIELSDKRDGGEFDAADEAMLVQIARIASIAVEQAGSEAALRASSDRLRAAVEAVQGVIWTNDPEGRMTGEQPGWAALTGQTRAEYEGHGWAAAIHPDDAEGTVESWNAAVAENRVFEFQHRVRRHDGTWWFFSVRAVPVRGPDGVIHEWVGVHTDITATEQAKAELRDETRALETLNRTGAALAGELDLERLVQMMTDAGVALTGARFGAYFHNVMDETGERLHLYTLSGADRAAFERLGRPRATALLAPSFRPEIIRSADILADPRHGANLPHAGLPRGHLPVRSYLAVPVISRAGNVLGGMLFGHPEPGRFTARHERLVTGLAAQAAIAIDNARLFQAVGAAKETLEARVEERTAERNRVWAMSRDLFAVMGFDGYLKAINPAWEATLGFDTATLLASPVGVQVHPDDHDAVGAVVERLRRGESVSRFEDRLRHADGSWRWIAWNLVPEGDVFYAVGRDVTAEREAAAQLEQAQDALRQAQKMEAVGQLTGGIAHDFNNLLAAVLGSFDLIRRKATDVERVRRYAEAGLQAAERGAKLTGQLLAFSRAQRIELKPLQLASVVGGMEDLLKRTLGPMVRLGLRLDDGGATVMSDATQVEMAVLNLAINARDAMPGGGELVIASTRRRVGRDPELAPGEYVELSVADTGTGMPPEIAARAFDPFFTTKGVGKGTGLGLSQVYGVAKQTGGTVRIESRAGAGTTVRILLPVTETEAAGAASDEAGAEVVPGRPATILVVDDDPDVRRVLADSLDALGYRVIEAEDGPTGLAALDAHAPDLMMLDFAMPGMNGAEVARQAREGRPGLPVVFASGYADTAAIEGALGPDVLVLRKPFRVDELQAVIAGALKP
jgi:PAS domain S-box-containing protein